ncbi:lytic transglycosylase domain-containing protein [Campylobacter fetus]|uniref:lytic transglycosylase domain-containing protein n=1 Tax=Campylobacter fetus TaxID=196 RepID=UPI0003D870D4|nr:lytic transglycosylase domain-containing protein [Campylobacter fetus]AHE95267.1 lytic transglycosylase [Campylobacter fetus subsp. venerealis cfvi03/293]CDF65955.1 Lytic transglycosylase, catalytic [Campylobacter fetus subsp. venerealis str. 84-112]
MTNKFTFIFLFICLAANANETKYNDLFFKYGAVFNIPPELLWGIAKHESNFDPKAINHNTNGTIDIGLMQINSIHKETIEAANLSVEDLYNPQISVYFASKILSKCLKKHGFTYQGLNCYNGKTTNNSYHKKVLAQILKRRAKISSITYKNYRTYTTCKIQSECIIK